MKENLSILLLKKLVLLPNQEIRLEINNEISKLALDDVYEEIRTMITEGKGKKTVYAIDYPEATYKNLVNNAETTATAEWTQKKI